MDGVSLEVDCYLDTAFITVSGSWRVHCVMGSRSCDVRFAIPMGVQGSILGVELEAPQKSYTTQLVAMEYEAEKVSHSRAEDGGFLKPHIFTLTIPEIDEGSSISVKVSWSQKLLYRDSQFSVRVPFNFPEYVTPAGKKISKKEKIQLNVNSGIGTELLCKTTSHPLKELRRLVGKLSFLYESEVLAWSSTEFNFSYAVSSSHIFGGMILQSPSVHDIDQREMFCLSLFPGTKESRKVFRKDVVFVIDISGSMQSALSEALSKFNAQDTSASHGSVPIIFLLTDGAVENERHICDVKKSSLKSPGSVRSRIYTFGIGNNGEVK